MESETGVVLRIERASTFDGEGLRTVVFLKGCRLTCAWCSTPESQSPAIEQGGDRTYGRLMTVAEVLDEVSKDEVFFFHSGGGVTLSGGEPLLQVGFAEAILKQSRFRGIGTALETSLSVAFDHVERVLPHLDTVFVDIKLMDPKAHREYCGVDNREILDNIMLLGHTSWPVRIVARLPLVPGVNDSDDNLVATARFCERAGIKTLEVLPYHRLGVPTYSRLGREYRMLRTIVPSAEHVRERRELMSSATPGLRIL